MEQSQEREKHAVSLENNHVYSVYDKTASHFANIHQRAWPKVKKFLQELEPGSIVADVGCGSGKYLNINQDVFTLGSDRCHGLVSIAKGEGHGVVTCDNLSLPFRDQSFDAVISIGVIHHFATRRRRISALCELARILQSRGRILVYVMAMEQHLRKFESQDVLVPWHVPFEPKTNNKGVSSRSSSTGSVSGDESEDLAQLVCLHDANVHSDSLRKPGYSNGSLPHLPDLNGTIDRESKFGKGLAKKPRSISLSESIRNKVLGIFGKSEQSRSLDSEPKQKTQWSKDMDYKKLLDYIMQEEAELLSQGGAQVFAVREFPASSRQQGNGLHLPNGDLNGATIIKGPQQTSKDLRVNGHDNGKGVNHKCNGSGGGKSVNGHDNCTAKSDSCQTFAKASPLERKSASNGACLRNSTGVTNVAKHGGNSDVINGAMSDMGDDLCSKSDSDDDDVFDTMNVSDLAGYSLQQRLHQESDVSNWVETTTKAIEVMQAQMKLSSETKSKAYQRSKMDAVLRYRDRLASQLDQCNGYGVTCPDSPTVSDNDSATATRLNSETSSVSSDTWSEIEEICDLEISQSDINDYQDLQSSSGTDGVENGETPQDDTACYRYYHVFREGELLELIEKHVKSLNVIKSYYDHANWCIVAEKV